MEEETEDKRSDDQGGSSSSIPLLSAGFCGVIGLLVAGVMGVALPLAVVLMALPGTGLPCGLSRLSKKQRKIKPVVISSIP